MPWLFALLLATWGNVVSWLFGAGVILPGGSWAFAMTGIAVVAISLAFARRGGLGADELGLDATRAVRGALLGAGSAALLGIVGVAALRTVAPAIVGRTVEYEPLSRVDAESLLFHIAFFLPLGAVIPEELAFRGTLFASFARRGTRRAILASAAAFALWHASVAVVTIGDTTIGPPSPWFVPAVAGALVVVLGGGVTFALLRMWTGSLWSTIAAHWTFNATMLVGLFATMAPPRPAP